MQIPLPPMLWRGVAFLWLSISVAAGSSLTKTPHIAENNRTPAFDLGSLKARGTLHGAATLLLSLKEDTAELAKQQLPTVELFNSTRAGGQEEAVVMLSSQAALKLKALPVSSEKYVDSSACFGAFVTLYFIYSVLCWWNEMRVLYEAERKAAEESERSGVQKERVVEWDFLKAVMLFFVLILHMGRNGWRRGGLSDAEQTFFLVLAPFPMPVFAFVSGIFGASVERRAMLKTVCYTLGTFFFARMASAAVYVLTPGGWTMQDIRDVGYLVFWYLKSLFIWRFTVTPLFHFAGKKHCPPLVTFAFVFMVCWLLRHLGLPYWTHEWTFFAPYYAQGLLLSPGTWLSTMKDQRSLYVTLGFLFIWVVGVAFSNSFREWDEVACAQGFLQCPNSHWPSTMTFEKRTPTAKTLLVDIHIYALQDSLSLAVSCLVIHCARPFQALAPRWAAVIYGCGTRTLYGYVLHFIFFLHFGLRMGVHFPEMPTWLWPLCSCALAFHALLVFCSSLTEDLFSSVIMPFWILKILDYTPFQAPQATTAKQEGGGSSSGSAPPKLG